MQMVNHPLSPKKATLSATDFLSFKAKKMLKNARSDAKSHSLPILRRLIASKVIRNVQLPDLFRHRQQIQRKHLLQLLALEAGFSDWAALKRNYHSLTAGQLKKDCNRMFELGYPNLWFSTHRQAREYIAEHGGQLITHGIQAMVVPGCADEQ